ncbi:MAG: serine/threonine-protein kinase [Elusimicrobiota bacterium]
MTLRRALPATIFVLCAAFSPGQGSDDGDADGQSRFAVNVPPVGPGEQAEGVQEPRPAGEDPAPEASVDAAEPVPGERSFAVEPSAPEAPPPARGGYPGGAERRLPMGPLAGAAAAALAFVGAAAWFKRRTGRAPPADLGVSKAEPSVEPAGLGGVLAGRYELIRVIGKGSLGEVWEANDRTLTRRVAVKKLDLDGPRAACREAWLAQGKTLASLRHPNIADVIEVVDLPAGLYLVLEMLSGKTLRQILAQKRGLSLAQAKQFIKPVGAALEFAHSRGLVHQDLNPSNIFLTDEGYLKVTEFGVRSPAPSSPPPSPLPARTPERSAAYSAPELGKVPAAPAADIYSLGVCLYEMVTGDLPLRTGGTGREYVRALLRVPGLSPDFDSLIQRAIADDPSARPGNVQEFFVALDRISDRVSLE